MAFEVQETARAEVLCSRRCLVLVRQEEAEAAVRSQARKERRGLTISQHLGFTERVKDGSKSLNPTIKLVYQEILPILFLDYVKDHCHSFLFSFPSYLTTSSITWNPSVIRKTESAGSSTRHHRLSSPAYGPLPSA